MTVLTARIGAYDDRRVFPLLREYFFATTRSSTREMIDKAFSDDRLKMVRDESPEVFETWVDEANHHEHQMNEIARCP